MKLLNLAVASIVDANTGNGVNQRFIEQFASAATDYEHRAHEIRANSVLEVLKNIKGSFQRYVEKSRSRAQERRDINAVLGLNDHLLKDIGLTEGDIHDLRWSQTSLEALNARRELNRIEAIGQLHNQSSSSVTGDVRNINTANQENYESKKCA